MAGCRNRKGQFSHCGTGRRAAPTYVKRYGVDTPITVTSKWAEFQPGDAVLDGWRGHGTVLGKVPATKYEPAAVHIAWKDGTESWAQVGSAELERGLMKSGGRAVRSGSRGVFVQSPAAREREAEHEAWIARHGANPVRVELRCMRGRGKTAALVPVGEIRTTITPTGTVGMEVVWIKHREHLVSRPQGGGAWVLLENCPKTRGRAAARKFPKGGPCAAYKTAPAREKCRARVSAKIGKMAREGMSQQQAVAAALSMEQAGRIGPRGGYHRAGRSGRRGIREVPPLNEWTLEIIREGKWGAFAEYRWGSYLVREIPSPTGSGLYQYDVYARGKLLAPEGYETSRRKVHDLVAEHHRRQG